MDANAAGLNAAEAQRLVNMVTRFATVMCIIIAIVKVSLYILSKSPVVKTSALDSCGDLIANCISLYTGYKMSKLDRVAFPNGQSRFEFIGVLVFSTLMAAMMFGNLLNNLEEVTSVEAKERATAILDFWSGLFGVPNYGPDGTRFLDAAGVEFNVDKWDKANDGIMAFARMAKEACVPNARAVLEDTFSDAAKGGGMFMLLNSLVSTGDVIDPGLLKEHFTYVEVDGEETLTGLSDNKQGEIVSHVQDHAANGDDEGTGLGDFHLLQFLFDIKDKDERKLWFANEFLACCATYKLCLWLACKLHFIPATGSSVLQALANDKRNDFFCTSSAIVCTFLAFYNKDRLNALSEGLADKMGSIISIVMSVVITYTWVSLLSEQIYFLSFPGVPEGDVCAVEEEIKDMLVIDSGDSISLGEVKAYWTSQHQAVEVDLVIEPGLPFEQVATQMAKIQKRIEARQDCGRCIVKLV